MPFKDEMYEVLMTLSGVNGRLWASIGPQDVANPIRDGVYVVLNDDINSATLVDAKVFGSLLLCGYIERGKGAEYYVITDKGQLAVEGLNRKPIPMPPIHREGDKYDI